MRAFWVRAVIALSVLCFGALANAQAINQNGAVVPFHVPSWLSNGYQGDGGNPSAPFLNGIGLFNGQNCPFGISSQTSPGVSTLPYGQLTICQTNSATTFSIQGLNGNPTPTLQFKIGNQIFPLPSGFGNVVGPHSSTVSDVACYNNTSGTLIKDCGPLTPVFIGLTQNIPSLHLAALIAAGSTNFNTGGFYQPGDGGEAQFWVNTGSARPGDQIDADGDRLSLSLDQPLTFEQLGMPYKGWIGTCVISGTTLTTSSTQSGTLVAGMTLTAAGGTGSISAGTKVISGSGTSWIVNNSQTVSSTVCVGNDSYPYLAAANQLGVHGLSSVGSHWFSEAPVIQGYAVQWSGPSGYGNGSNAFQATWYVPTGYSALVAVPNNATVNAQGDVTLSGSVGFGGASGWSVDHVFFQVGNHNLPGSTVNNRPAVAIYTPGSLTNWQATGADGDGLYIFGNSPTNLADKNHIANFTIQNAYDNGIETAGGDGNTTEFSNFIISTVGASCIYEHSFLGNIYDGTPQVQTCGQVNAVVRRSNNLYYSVIDSNTGNDPLTSPNDWALWTASVGSDTYNSGTTYRVGVSVRTSGGADVSHFVGTYVEPDAPPMLLQAVSGNFYLTNISGGIIQSGINTTNASGYNGITGAVGRANSFVTYTPSGPGYLATGLNSGELIGVAVNNTNPSPNVSTSSSIRLQSAGSTFARWRIKAAGNVGGSGFASAFSSWNIAGSVETDLLCLDGQALVTFSCSDNTISLGASTKRWSDTETVKLNGIPISSTGLGYATGAGGAVTQATSRTTGVTLNTNAGAITLFSAAGSATPFTFVVTDSKIAVTDTVNMTVQTTGITDHYQCTAEAAAGSFAATCVDQTGTTTEAPIVNFTRTTGATSMLLRPANDNQPQRMAA